MDGESKERPGLINEQHAFQNQLIPAVKPNLPLLHCEQAPYRPVYAASASQN